MSRRLALVAALALLAALPSGAAAAVDPPGCTQEVAFDPTIPTWDQYWNAHPKPAGTPAAEIPIQPFAAGAAGRSTGKNTTANLDEYFDAVTAAVAASPSASKRVGITKRYLGKSELGNRGVRGREISFWIVGTAGHIANVEDDARFWAGVRNGEVSEDAGLAAVSSRPAFGWITATPHGNEPAAGEAITRMLYEAAARTDCAMARRLANLDLFMMPVRNPDGHDNNYRTTSFGFDPNRDFGTRNQQENRIFIPVMNRYPGLFYIDAHQQGTGYFFPPNEDPVHHEISQFSLDLIQKTIGPAVQQTFNDQSGSYQNYNEYDLFTPEYGDTVPSLIMGSAGMTYEKGSDEAYSKQVYDHYLAMDETVHVVSDAKANITAGWVRQWKQATDQGAACKLQPNKLVSPLHDTIEQQPVGDVCGYFFRPDAHLGDVASLLKNLTEVGVRVYRLNTAVGVNGYHAFGGDDQDNQVLPAGTIYVPMGQPQKHWIQAILGENPFIAYKYYYDVVTWSYGLQRGLGGDGLLRKPLPAGASLTQIAAPDFGTVSGTDKPVLAFNTDSAQALGLLVELLARGVTVYRGTVADPGDGLFTGAAYVDAASLRASGVDLAGRAKARQTPVVGLARYPVARSALARPKIGLYTGEDDVPTNPLNVKVDANGRTIGDADGQCYGAFCQALHTLTQKDALPSIVPVTTSDIASGLSSYTALINPGYEITGAAATGLQRFVNRGGRYVGAFAEGAASARNAQLTNQDTVTIDGLLTPGSTFDARFATTNPVAYGFDRGGWIYREDSDDPVFQTAAEVAPGSGFGKPVAAVSYAPSLSRSYGYSVNASSGPVKLDGRPAVVDQAYGSGHAVMFGYDPFFRSWKESDERLVLNAALYPTGRTIAPDAAPAADAPSPAQVEASLAPAAPPVAAGQTAPAASRPLTSTRKVSRDVLIRVKRRYAARLKSAVRAARLPRSVTRKLSYRTTRVSTTLVIKGVRTSDEHARAPYMSRLIHTLKKRKVPLVVAQV